MILEGIQANQRDVLVHRAESLLKQAADTVELLTKANRATESKAIEQDADELKKVVDELKADTASVDILKHEHQVRDIERRLISEIRRAHQKPTVDLRQRLLNRADDLTKHVDEAIKELTAQSKTEEVKKFQEEEEKLKTVAEQLKSETEHAKIAHLEQQIIQIELRVAHHLRTVHVNHHDQPTTPTSY